MSTYAATFGNRYYHGGRQSLPLEVWPLPAARPTLVYVFDADHATKVGVTCGSAETRAEGIAKAAGIDPPLVVATYSFRDGTAARRVEKVAHWILREHRGNGEWFHCHPIQAVDAVRQAMKTEAFDAYQAWWLEQQAVREAT